MRLAGPPSPRPGLATVAQDATQHLEGTSAMDEFTKQRIQEIGDEIREGVQARGLQVGTAEAEAWVRSNYPAGEFWAFIAGPQAEQRQAALEAGS
jgi:hypothetical protein